MAHSIGLALYLLRSRGAGATVPPPDRPPRPPGPLVWLHAPTAAATRPLLGVARRLLAAQKAAALLTATVPGDPVPPLPGLLAEPVPEDTPASVRAFLNHWAPAVAVIAEGELRPALIAAVQDRGIPVVLVDAREPWLPRGNDGWWPGLVRGLMTDIRRAFAIDEAAARALRRAGVPAAAVVAAGRMELPSVARHCNEAERAALRALLATRPVWLAAGVPEAEEAAVIEAHRAVLRLAHRMLLIVVPEDPARARLLADRMAQVEGWAVARRAADEEPDPETQAYIVEGTAEYGLWYRLAPVSFLGGSLAGGGCRIDPAEPAALGSAVVHGPRTGVHGGFLGRLAAAQATALVGSAADLAETLGELLAPDRAARLAGAAWAVLSDGAQVSDRIAAEVLALAAARPEG
jgi:3-deoxy-D-manno-octulosonic-acid transferase